MTFNSLQFLVFFPVVAALYYATAHRFRWMLLLAASSYFYMAFVPKYIIILFFLIAVDYCAGIAIERAPERYKRFCLIASIIANLGTLFIFKYFNFFNDIARGLADILRFHYSFRSISILLPIGLSFHVFQSLSYVIEVYRGRQKAERHLGIYALYVMFFPQLVAGPIERPQHLIHQFRATHQFDATAITQGLQMMLWGFFKKLVIADSLAILVDHVYGNIALSSGLTIAIAVVLFSYQLYCDFSGYSDIAVGSAAVLGFSLVQNFNRPYAARSIAEFWRRWHISLSDWLRDYVYYPLAKKLSRHRRTGVYASILITFVLIGLWHGANWTFVMLGVIHGVYMVLAHASKTLRDQWTRISGLMRFSRIRGAIQVIATFFLVSMSWIFFRAPSIGDAVRIIQRMVSGAGYIPLAAFLHTNSTFQSLLGITRARLAIVLVSIVIMEIIQYAFIRPSWLRAWHARSPWVRMGLWYALIFWILVFGNFSAGTFIYFQFR